MQKRKNSRLLSTLHNLRLFTNSSSKSASLFSLKSQNSNWSQNRRKQNREISINICKQNTQIFEKFKHVNKTKTLLDQMLIIQSLKNHFIFNSLLEDQNTIANFVNIFEYCEVKQKSYLISQEDHAHYFFILHTGVLSIQVDGKEKNRLYPGKGFGQLALLYSAPRSASVQAVKDSTLWYIDRFTFQKYLNIIMSRKFQQNLEFVHNISFFAPLTNKQKNKIVQIVITQKFGPNQKIFQPGAKSTSMLVVKSGKLKKSIRGYSFKVLKRGDVCQELAVLTKNFTHCQTLMTISKSQILSLGADKIQKALGKSLPLVICRNIARQKLMTVSCFNCLSPEILDKIIDTFQIRKIDKHQIVTYVNLPMKNLIFFIIEGKYEISNLNQISEIYGCQSLEQEQRQCKYEFWINFTTQGRIAFSTVQKIENSLQCSFADLQQKNNQLRNFLQKHKKQIIIERKILQKCNLDSFVKLDSIGSGHFAEVFKVKCKINEKFYALKVIRKQSLKISYIENQRNILLKIMNPFIMDYYGYFEDEERIYFIVEYIQGIQLFTALRYLGLLSSRQSKFYAAILFEAIYSMHKLNIIYRDLKPENIMLEKNGYLKIIDLGTCKQINSSCERTYTIIGTPSYMAPQIIEGKGYSFEADFWSLGVVLYEFLAGYLPFGQQFEDPYQIFQEIVYGKLEFYSYMQDQDSNDLIQRLLHKKPYERLLGSYSTIKNHPFFDEIVWQNLQNKQIQPFYRCEQEILEGNTTLADHFKKI